MEGGFNATQAAALSLALERANNAVDSLWVLVSR